MIISLFGPDGVGKTRLAKEMSAELALPVLSGTDISSWPDTSWHERFVNLGINERKINDMDHFYEKVIRAHEQARLLNDTEGGVIMDSDPVHKIFLHQHAVGRTAGLLVFLKDLADYHPDYEQVDLHLRVSRQGTPEDHAKELQRRIVARGVDSIFDPTSVEGSVAMIHASEALEAELLAIHQEVWTAYSDEPFEPPRVV